MKLEFLLTLPVFLLAIFGSLKIESYARKHFRQVEKNYQGALRKAMFFEEQRRKNE